MHCGLVQQIAVLVIVAGGVGPLLANSDENPETVPVREEYIHEDFSCTLKLAKPFVSSYGQMRTSVQGNCSTSDHEVTLWVAELGLFGVNDDLNVLLGGSTGHPEAGKNNSVDWTHVKHFHNQRCESGYYYAFLTIRVSTKAGGSIDVVNDFRTRLYYRSCPTTSGGPTQFLQRDFINFPEKVLQMDEGDEGIPILHLEEGFKKLHLSIALCDLNSQWFFSTGWYRSIPRQAGRRQKNKIAFVSTISLPSTS